ncbi:MAG: 3'(2'), 5'-bisphosphate nucleotidase [Moritella sp.]|jgi:3'(2'), 5'-bisphosphate nucleotidase
MQAMKLIPELKKIARATGGLIYDIYQSGNFEQEVKADHTPVTSADMAAHLFLIEQLSLLTPDIPVLSEEDCDISVAERQAWETYWLVDPLDGTQEFISRSGDFATIIALVHKNNPIIGMIYGPRDDVLYWAVAGQGAYKVTAEGEQQISSHTCKEPLTRLNVVVSRVQNPDNIRRIVADDVALELQALGSASLKGCLVAEGKADCYIRLGTTGEWDTAGTQCIVTEAGGAILDLGLENLSYNKRDTLKNPDFIVLGDTNLQWHNILTR